MQVDYGYASHRRFASQIIGTVESAPKGSAWKKGETFTAIASTPIIENRVNGELRSVTVLNSDGRKVVRLMAHVVRYV
jgi:hypothetical protein